MTHPTLRNETPADAPAIAALIERAFASHPFSSHTEQHIVRALREAEALTVSLVAELDGVVVGHIAISPVSISDNSQGWYGLGPVAVEPRVQRRGIGIELVNAALDRLRSVGASGCVVLGDAEYYGRFGFAADCDLVLADVPVEHFTALAFGSRRACGEVLYHPVFAAEA